MQYPRILQTKNDYEFVRTHFPKKMWERDFELLLETTRDWFFVREVEAGEWNPIQSATQKVEVNMETGRKYLYEWRTNPNAKIFRIGYTEDEVIAILNSEE